jgi:Fur family ferric uptake transcriptional regulator
MTASPDALPLRFETFTEAVHALRESGLRLSTPRRLILEALFAADGPVSATHLSHKIPIDESSVYRNLETLEQHGIVRHLHLGHSPGLYVLVSEEQVEYLFCSHCAKVIAVSPDRLADARAAIAAELGFHARFTHFAIVGVCQECSEQISNAALADSQTLHGHGDRIHAHAHSSRHEH